MHVCVLLNQCPGELFYFWFWIGQVEDHSGYLFGGFYDKIHGNPLTGTASCPPKFYPRNFGPEGMYVCISDDYELAAKYSVPFAGFFSCSTGNPLTLKKTGKGIKNGMLNLGYTCFISQAGISFLNYCLLSGTNFSNLIIYLFREIKFSQLLPKITILNSGVKTFHKKFLHLK